MPIYFLVQDAAFFHEQVSPALAASWRQRSFAPCRPLADALLPQARIFAERYHIDLDEALFPRAGKGLPFDRDLWRLLAGEILLYGARDVPEIQTAADTLTCLLARDRYLAGDVPRQDFAPIQQVHCGSRDVRFGGAYYRPEQAGLNDVADVARLADYLQTVDPRRWTVADLAVLRDALDDEERAEELEFAREWFPELLDLYRQAGQRQQVLVCENVQAAWPG
jgi:hypothetical protein